MKKSSLLLILLGTFILSCCDKNEEIPQKHIHVFDESTLQWSWSKSSVGMVSSASIKCSGCGETFTKNASIKEDVTKEATCVASGEKTYTARVQFGDKNYFDTKQFVLDVTGHTFNSNYTFDENKHYLSCTDCGEVLSQEPHDFGEFVVDIEPKVGYYGSKSRICNVCGYKDVQIINKLIPSISEVKALIDAIPAVNQITIYNTDVMLNAIELYDYLDADSLSSLGNAYVTKMESVKEIINNKYGIAFKVSGEVETSMLNADLNISNDFKQTYGSVLKLEGNSDGWTEIVLDSLLPEDAYEVKFAVYVSQPTDLSLSMEKYVSNTYDFTNKVFTNKPAGNPPDGNKITLNKNTWTEFTLPADDFAKARYFGLYCTTEGTQYGVTKGFPGYITNFYVIKKGYYRKSPTEIMNLINSLLETSSLNPYDYSKINTISTNLDMYDGDEKSLITNIDKFTDYALAWNNKYKIIYDPTINGLPSFGGVSNASISLGIGSDNTYGTVLEIDTSFDAAATNFQIWFYSMKQFSYNPNDKLIFAIKSPYETISGTSQTMWLGNDATRVGNNLNPNGWTEFNALPSSFNTADFSSDFKIILQRYDNARVLSPYSGKYLLTCIIAEKGN